jgi:hypothetical protein
MLDLSDKSENLQPTNRIPNSTFERVAAKSISNDDAVSAKIVDKPNPDEFVNKHYLFELGRWDGIKLNTSLGNENVTIYSGDKQTTETWFASKLTRSGNGNYSTPQGTLFVLKKLSTFVINDGNRGINSGNWKLIVSGTGSEFDKLRTEALYFRTAKPTFYGHEDHSEYSPTVPATPGRTVADVTSQSTSTNSSNPGMAVVPVQKQTTTSAALSTVAPSMTSAQSTTNNEPCAFFTEQEFGETYISNKAAFYRRFKGRVIQVQAPVDQINQDRIMLSGLTGGFYVDCYYDSAQFSRVDSLRTNQLVTVVGRLTDEAEPFRATLRSCTFR